MTLKQQRIVLYITLGLGLVCLGFFAGWHLRGHMGKCKAIVERHWREFERAPDKVALGGPLSNPSLVYGQSIREIWRNPDAGDIKIYFKCDPAMTTHDCDGYAYKGKDGRWYYKIP